jgi:hypothetical protein
MLFFRCFCYKFQGSKQRFGFWLLLLKNKIIKRQNAMCCLVELAWVWMSGYLA